MTPTCPMLHWPCCAGLMAYMPGAAIIPEGMAPPPGPPIIPGATPISPAWGFPMKPLGMVIPTIMPELGAIMAAPPWPIMAPITVEGGAPPMPGYPWYPAGAWTGNCIWDGPMYIPAGRGEGRGERLEGERVEGREEGRGQRREERRGERGAGIGEERGGRGEKREKRGGERRELR